MRFVSQVNLAVEWELLPGIEVQAEFEVLVRQEDVFTDEQMKAALAAEPPFRIELNPDKPAQ